MLKNKIAIVGLGLAGETVAYQFQQKNYPTYLINGSEQNERLSRRKSLSLLDDLEEAIVPEKPVAKTTAAKTARKTTRKPRKTSKATIRKTAATVDSEVFVQIYGQEFSQQEIMEKVVAAWEAEGKKITSIKRAKLYVKPEEGKAYYVVNEGLKNGSTGAVDL